jgi:DNA topoisomerase-6 subunit B
MSRNSKEKSVQPKAGATKPAKSAAASAKLVAVEPATTEDAPKASRGKRITSSSTAEYFSKNLQQVGFSSPTKAVLTTLKEAVDNSLDACEEADILPDISVEVERVGSGSMKNTDKIRIKVDDNGPGIDPDDIGKVFGEYLASSKFGRGRCSRGQQGIGISAATTYALQTTATGVRVTTKQARQRKAVSCMVEVDLKNNKGIVKDKQTLDWNREHGTSVEFFIDGRIQLNGEAGLLNYIRGNVLVNPHMTLNYNLPEVGKNKVARVTKEVPRIPEATEPHPHTMKLGEFIAHARLFGKTRTANWLKTGFSRISDKVLDELVKTAGLPRSILDRGVDNLSDQEFKDLFVIIQNAKLMAPSTQSVLSIGEEGLSMSIQRLGEVDFFSVVSRKPTICDFKPIQVEVAVARLKERAGITEEDPVQVLRFANRVPLQFDKAACAIVKAICDVNWRSYGIRQPKDALPLGPYIIAVSVVSPFIKFKNASKETIDASDELVEELRRALMQAGQRLSRYISRENKAAELEEKLAHIEQFGPVLVETLCRITGASDARKLAAEEGLKKILGRDAKATKEQLADAKERLDEHLDAKKKRLKMFREEDDSLAPQVLDDEDGMPEEAPDDELEADISEESPEVKKSKKNAPKSGGKAKAKPSVKSKEKSSDEKTVKGRRGSSKAK